METLKTLEKTLIVSALDPRQKLSTINQYFDALEPGDSLIIQNDHDPKPLYSKLLKEKGNTFSWHYLEQGPQVWKVKITRMAAIHSPETLGQIVAKDARKASIFKKYGIDFCCGGNMTISEACEELGLDEIEIRQELLAIESTTVMTDRNMVFDEWSPTFLADYIINQHHNYVKSTLPDLQHYAEKVARVHGAQNSELFEINDLVQEVCVEMSEHMEKEERILFPFIKALFSTNEHREEMFSEIQMPIKLMEEDHLKVGNALKAIRRISNNYSLPPHACGSYSFLFKMLDEFENDLHMHIHLENNILFPKAIERAQKIES